MTSHDNTSGSGLTSVTRTEAEARCEQALKVARQRLARVQARRPSAATATIGEAALTEIIIILDGGKS